MIEQHLLPLLQIILIDVVLAGDNAIVVGLAASRVAPELRQRVIFWGIGAAVVLRILLSLVAIQLLAIIGLTLAGGILLLWVCWRMYRELMRGAYGAEADHDLPAATTAAVAVAVPLGFWAAMTQITIADLSMSLDNILAVAAAANGNFWILTIGLVLSIVLMGAAATYIAKLLESYPSIAWIGLAVIVYVALKMIWQGTHEVGCLSVSMAACQAGLISTVQALVTLVTTQATNQGAIGPLPLAIVDEFAAAVLLVSATLLAMTAYLLRSSRWLKSAGVMAVLAGVLALFGSADDVRRYMAGEPTGQLLPATLAPASR